jgi:hypothetical protein
MHPVSTAARRFFRRTDLLWIVGLFALCLFLLLYFQPTEKGRYAAIYHENDLLALYSLQDDQSITLPDYPAVTFEIRDGAICFQSSDCPDQTCVRTGFISHGSEYAVCLPYGLSVRILDEDAPDAVTY